MDHDPASMSTDAVSEVLDEVAAALAELTAGGSAGHEVVDDDSVVTPAGRPDPSWPRPHLALRGARLRLRGCRLELAREFAAWWADLASVVLADTVEGLPVQSVRAAAGAPFVDLSENDLPYLPGRSFRHDEPVLVDQLTADRRRDQLWGPVWTDHRLPALPSAADLAEWLTAYGVSGEQVAAARDRRKLIADAGAGSPPRCSDAGDEEVMDRYEDLTGFLAGYASELTAIVTERWSDGR